MLAKDWSERKEKYDFVVVGSGYGEPSWLSILLQKALSGYLDPGKEQFTLYYFLKKT